MSDAGIRAAKALHQLDPTYAKALAADLRNSITLASVVADELDLRAANRTDALDIRDSVTAVKALAAALWGK